MARSKSILRKTAICAAAVLMAGSFTAAQLLSVGKKGSPIAPASASTGETITDVTGKVASDLTSSLNGEVVKKLPSGIDEGREISVIVRTTDSALVSAYDAQSGVSRYSTVSAFTQSASGEAVVSRIERANSKALSRLRSAGVEFELGSTYKTLIGGFELVVKAGEYEKIVAALDGTDALPSISEEYAPAEAQLVENKVNVNETGIFNSSDSAYKGEGTLIAVLDTGCDYTHSVFDPEIFARDVDETKLAMTREKLDGVIGKLTAARYTRELSSEKVYINDKIPYAYDYADKDTDVYPLDNQHGTHVSGIILGNNVGSTKNNEGDPEIVGVAPLAQLATMKVFSDTSAGARQSWLLAALEDCVQLGVDVINMSLGSSAGFTSEDDDEAERIAYENVGKAGISLVTAASNDYNSTFGSAKNGNLGLTSNPDSATVGAPSTFSSALSVASISGVKTSYIKYGKRIIYFTEAADAASEPMDFVDELLSQYGVNSKEFEYILVPGIGSYADYAGLDVEGKIALVRRGTNSFEEKARVAIEDMKAAGVIIYNNVSGDISMTVGGTKGAICSISQDDGELLAASKKGKITISRSQVAGPFMSDFSSWGPTPDLRIKPEITAHGGDILSAVPGQRYDRLSGTSMASPNQAGVTAIIRGYVKEKFGLGGNDDATRREVNARVNQILMSTADIAYNTDGLPYAVRKQGAGLANLNEALTTPAYITTYERNDAHLYDGSPRFLVDADHVMDKAKIEYGDDRDRTGVYDLVFTINNISDKSLTYNVGALIQTEGVSETPTVRGDTTVTEKGYELSPKVTVTQVDNAPHKGTSVTVGANGKATVTVRIELSESDKAYLEQSFKYGMYVEGFITLEAKGGNKIDLNVPFLAFYGDWTEAPMFDLDYFETNPDELDNGLDPDEKKMPDAYATQPIGSMYSDYIMYLGSFPFLQDPTATQIPASREHIALTNQENEMGVNSIYAVWAGMLRAAKRVDITITDTSTGEVIWSRTEVNVRKTYSTGSTFYYSDVEIDFSVPEHDLKNNTQYNVRLEGYIDYGAYGEQKNVKSVFEFPFVTDFQAPVVTGVEFYTEVDNTDLDKPKTRTFARLSIFDNHYAAGGFFGYMRYNTNPETADQYLYEMPGFSNYSTTISAPSANTTTDVIFELTDYVDDIANAVHPNTFTVQLFDYALNISTFEIKIPDEVVGVNFTGDNVTTDNDGIQTITLNRNEKFMLAPEVYPTSAWASTLEYEVVSDVADTEVARIVGGTLLGVESGDAKLKVYRGGGDKSLLLATVNIHVLGEGEEGYAPKDPAGIEVFRLTGYRTDNAYYFMSSEDRGIGETGDETLFPVNTSSYYLSMYPSEKVTLQWELLSYEKGMEVTFSSSNPRVATVNSVGQIEVLRQGSARISVSAVIDGKVRTSEYVTINVKDSYERNGPYLTGYRGYGQIGEDGVPTGIVDIEADLGPDHGLTTIEQFAFSHYDYVPKGPGDVIDEEDPYNNKIWYVGENDHIKKVIIPEGVEMINMYAFAGMEGLEEVVLPSTLKQIGVGAFLGCTKLRKVEGLEYVQLINQDAFRNSGLYEVNLASVIAVGNYAFAGTKLAGRLELPASAQSIGAYAFSSITGIDKLVIRAATVKLGEGAFAGDTNLSDIPAINAANIPEGLFDGDENLTSVTIGKDVESIDRNAFKGTGVSSFSVATGNKTFRASDDNKTLYRIGNGDREILCVVPTYSGRYRDDMATKVGAGAFAGLNRITAVELPNVTEIGESAFYDCPRLTSVKLSSDLKTVPDYAFYLTPISGFDLKNVTSIGNYAFFGCKLVSIEIPAETTVGTSAFMGNTSLVRVTVGDKANIGAYAFANTAFLGATETVNVQITGSNQVVVLSEVGYLLESNALNTVTIGNDVTIGSYAFAFNGRLRTANLGRGVTVGDHAFFVCTALSSASLSGVTAIGDYAFAGAVTGVAEIDPDTLTLDYWEPNHRVQSNNLASVDLTGLTSIGDHAFAFNASLTNVTLGEGLKEIAPYAFYGTRIASIDLGNVEKVGSYAFAAHTSNIFYTSDVETVYALAVKELDLGKATEIGAHAFENSAALETVTLLQSTDGQTIGDYAFAGCTKLGKVNGIGLVPEIGAHAFDGAAISGELRLGSAVSVGDLAFADNKGITAVSFGTCLKDIGDNPFAGDPEAVFTKKDGTDTFDISDSVTVIGGVLYRKSEFAGGDLRGVRTAADGKTEYYLYGLELIAYPASAAVKQYAVEEGTVRIAARAFMGADIECITLPESLAAIGDKAFYQMDTLKIVVFHSLKAPILEEQYDEAYQIISGTDGNLPAYYLQNEEDDGSEHLHILPYGMWFVDATSFFYGANFVDYIGKAAGDLTMIRPKNGSGYENFIYSQYFDLVLDGPVSASDTTRSVVRAISVLPDADDVSADNYLEVKPLVAAARALYDAISEDEQRALVENYQKLRAIEERITLLERTPSTPVEPEEGGKNRSGLTVGLAVSSCVLVAAVIVMGAVIFARKKAKRAEADGQDDPSDDTPSND